MAGGGAWENHSFTTYLILEEAVTPNDPDGTSASDSIVFTVPPMVRFNDTGTADSDWIAGSNLVNCFGGDMAAGKFKTVAVDTETAIARGCS